MVDNTMNEQSFTEGFEQFKKGIGEADKLFNNLITNLCPTSPPKQITIEVVHKKGIFGIGRKVTEYKIDAYISMNNILCMDFKDKDAMKKYFEALK